MIRLLHLKSKRLADGISGVKVKYVHISIPLDGLIIKHVPQNCLLPTPYLISQFAHPQLPS